MFTTGQWHLLMEFSSECTRAVARRCVHHGDLDAMTSRAGFAGLEHSYNLGELSASRQALDSAEVAFGNLARSAQPTSSTRPVVWQRNRSF